LSQEVGECESLAHGGEGAALTTFTDPEAYNGENYAAPHNVTDLLNGRGLHSFTLELNFSKPRTHS